MPLYTKKEFATLCGVDTKKLSTYVSRGKAVYSGDYVDDQIALNAAFLKEMSTKAKLKEPKPLPVEKEALRLTRPLNKKEREVSTPQYLEKEKPNTTRDEDEEVDREDYSKMILEKKELEIKKLKQEIKKLELGNNKTQGNFVSIDLVKNLIVLHSESLKTAYEDGLNEYVVKFAGKNQMPREEIAVMKQAIVESVNESLVKSIDNTKKSLRRLQTETSNQRGKGEHS